MASALIMMGTLGGLPARVVAQEAQAVTSISWPPSPSTTSLEIRSRHAAISVQVAPGNEVRISTEGGQPASPDAGRGGQPPAPRLELDERAGVLAIRIRDDEDGSRVRITVPGSVPLRIVSRYAPISVAGARTDLELSTHSADVAVLDFAGSILVDTWSGNVDVEFSAVRSTGACGFTTHSGTIRLAFPSPPDADVRFTTSRGSLRSVFTLTEQRSDHRSDANPGRRLRTRNWRSGRGGLVLWFRTYNGDVELRSPTGAE